MLGLETRATSYGKRLPHHVFKLRRMNTSGANLAIGKTES
jgi:hypothetical protein